MSVNNGVITAPVSIYDVQRALGNASPDLGTLCVASNINIWAKYKPVDLVAISTLNQWDDANNEWKDDATWFHGKSGKEFGLTPYVTTSFASLRANTTGGMNGWAYARPQGGAVSPYRLTDFAGYNHSAPQAVIAFSGTSSMQDGQQFSAALALSTGGFDNVTVEDFRTTLYFGVAIVNGSGGVVYHGTASSHNGGDVTFTISGLTAGTYTVVPFFCTQRILPTAGSFAQSYTFWSVPSVSPYSLSIVAYMTDITAVAQWLNEQRTSMTITVTNNSNSNVTGSIYIRRRGRTWSDNAYTDEKDGGPYTFVAGNPQTYTFSGMSNLYMYHALVRLTTGEVYEVLIEEPFPEL